MSEGSASIPTPNPGTMFGRYKVLRKVGEGGMGVVYEAEHSDLNKRVALKTLRANLAGDAVLVGRFVREGQAAARIRHPNVVDVTDVGIAHGVPYLVMEMLDGETLAARIRRGPVACGELSALMLPVCAAVAAAHAQGVLHRDLKPDNILLQRAPDGSVRPKVVDFGIAKIFDDDASLSLTSTAATLGTPYYMSPEQARGARDVDVRSDQYALGVILYEASTGKRPFDGASLLALAWTISQGAPLPLREVLPELPAAFEALVLRAMASDPAQRFASVRELGVALLPFADERTQWLWEHTFSASEPPLPAPAPRPSTARATPILAETVGDPRPVVSARRAIPTPASSRPARPWWMVVLAGTALLGVAAYRLTRPPTPIPQPHVIAKLVAPPASAPPPMPAVGAGDLAPAPEAVTVRAPLVRPLRAPARGGQVARRPPPSASAQREIPME